jgi:acyl-CoA thioesterase
MHASEIVNKMMEHDYFSQWLGIQVLELKTGYCKLHMQVRKEMLNGFSIAHGGISYSFADSALAFASNSGGRKSLSIETSISHVNKLVEHAEIIAEAFCENETSKIGHYTVKVYLKNEPQTTIALFKGIVYKTSKNWE